MFSKIIDEEESTKILESFKVEPVPGSTKLKVTWVKKGSIAEKAGIKVGQLLESSDSGKNGSLNNAIKLKTIRESNESESY